MTAFPMPRSRPDRNTACRAVLTCEYEQLAVEAHHKAAALSDESRAVWRARDLDWSVRSELLSRQSQCWTGIARAFEDAAAEERQRAESDGWQVHAVPAGGAA